ncbi:UNKNOWN [Stylonychia lemnae]|uniref:Uncharacterized protein n=1 Tax=Stylonychia lemnae TaxID=5949 RepID=A0A078ACZ3_STYLE|nr:UNKNOWN [Stylonychia lemnae]|eukprot:CDW80089.1 UNKNOWN [Stylonychia lemnae]
MKIQSLLALTLLGFASVNSFTMEGLPKREVKKNKLGAMEVIDWAVHGMTKTVYLPQKSILQDYERQTQNLEQALIQTKVNKERMSADKLYKCDSRLEDGGKDPDEAGYFIPVEAGSVSNAQPTTVFTSGLCFQNVTFTYQQSGNENDIGDVTITVDAQNPRTMFCKDWFLFGNAEFYHIETFFFHGKHQVTFKNMNTESKEVVQKSGIQMYMFCDGYVDTFISVFNTVLAFVGGLGTNPYIPIFGSHVPEYMEKANLKFLNDTIGYDMQLRSNQTYDYDESLIQSGDFLAIMRLDGVDPIIMYGSGTHAGHSTMALRFDDGELYVIESQDGWYWPRHGIQKNKFSQWIEWAKDADFHVAHLPLSPEARAKFNETAAREFFNQTEGLPYGYHNFLFGWVDTPVDNWPPLLPSHFINIVFSILEGFTPSTVDIFLNQALNHRLNTTGLNLKQVAAEAANRNLTVEDLMSQVEVEGWTYTGLQNDGRSYVCSAYVAAVYKAAGLFGDFHINGPEFTPRDVYTLNFFDLNYKKPESCQQVDPSQPFCQILGKYRMTLPGYSTITPYEHMDEKCPSIAPDFVRPDGC